MQEQELFTVKQAAEWASQHLHRNVTVSNISYLIQYGRIRKIANNGNTLVSKSDLANYYESSIGRRENNWLKRLGEDINWALSFDYLKESERTKHVHRLHPYKGKFIPQLVEYFLDDHINDFKKEAYFRKGDIILDPFCGSGTTLVQANELGMHAIGVEVSSFNTLMANVKISKYDLVQIYKEVELITSALKNFISSRNIQDFDNELLQSLSLFNRKYFPSPEYRAKVRSKEINEEKYGREKEQEFLPIFNDLVNHYHIELRQSGDRFLDKWYLQPVLLEIEFVRDLINQVSDDNIKDVLSIILSRTTRSCRATTHFDLATLKKPVLSTYYCHKHGKICKPLFSIVGWWVRYAEDTIKRLGQFAKIRTDTNQICLTGDAKTIDLNQELNIYCSRLYELMKDRKIDGIFSSPPYVGLIDYHEQHAYSYDLFHLERKDNLEIGTLSNGQGKESREQYVQSIAKVMINCRRFLAEDANIFLVANDKYNLYPLIAKKSGLSIIQQFKRPVLHRTERDKGAYAEIIFHMKEQRI